MYITEYRQQSHTITNWPSARREVLRQGLAYGIGTIEDSMLAI